MRTLLSVDVLSYRKYVLLYRRERAHEADEVLFSYERWSRMRTALIQHLARIGKIDPTGYGSGKFINVGVSIEYDGSDFFIGEDWFKLGIFTILLLHWEWLALTLLRECKCFVMQNPDFVLSIEKASFRTEDMFELIITPSHCYLAFFEKTAKDAWMILQHQQYDKIRDVLRFKD